MRGVLVAIDLETTGLDASDAEIIEIGAVKFRDREILDTYQTLVDPGLPVPPRVTSLTGIRSEDLLGAPKIREALPPLVEFTGGAPIVGHNVDFDLRFLHKQGVLKANPAIDTYELAALLRPTAARYNLNALMQLFNIAPEGAYHRALTDAIADARLYMAFWEMLISDLPVDLLREVTALARELPWRGKLPFEAAVKVREGERGVRDDLVMRAFSVPVVEAMPPGRASTAAPPDPEQMIALLERSIPGDQAFPGQAETARAIDAALSQGERLMLETASDHPLAYLIPAALRALYTGERVVISTGTERLRRQLFEREIPALRERLGQTPLRATLLRRRADYLCPVRLQIMRHQLPSNVEELRLLAKTLIWLGQGGDLDSLADEERLSIRGPGEQIAWERLSAEADDCAYTRCEALMNGTCPLYRDRRAAESAHLIIVDHALLLDDARSPNPALPTYRQVIVAEAHTLEDAITEGLHSRLNIAGIRRLIVDLGDAEQGLLGDVLAATQPVLPERAFEHLADGIQSVAEAALQMRRHADRLFRAFMAFLQAVTEVRTGDFVTHVRLSGELRGKAAFNQVRGAWGILSQFTATIAEVLPQLARRLHALQGKHTIAGIEDLLARLESIVHNIGALHRRLDAFVNGTDENAVCWIEIGADAERVDRLSLHTVPLHPGPLLRQYVWNSTDAAVLVSPTLRTGGEFEYLQERLGAEAFRTLAVNSPEDSAQTLLVYLPTDIPEPNEGEVYQRAVERGIIELATATAGRLMALFTSYAQLRQSSHHITARLALGDIAVFDQSDGTSQAALLEGFREAEKAVLLGVRGFWDDVALSEDDLAALVIVRLPFTVPTDPVFAARSETFDSPFTEYTVPNAILRFRQGVERLIHARRRPGVLAILDKRMTTRDYGQMFLDSLPPCTIRRAPMAGLPDAARAWLNAP